MNCKLIVEYDGTAYAGWQRQDNAVAVQQRLEEAIEQALGIKVSCTASGRTDAGVHAAGQCVNFKADTVIPPEKLSYVINRYLPADIRVLSSCAVRDDFNARFMAVAKTYRYSVYTSKHGSPLHARTHYCINYRPDVEKMRAAASYIVGTHDFSAFCASGSSAKTTVRTVYSVDVEENGDVITITVRGNGFLYNMVRIIAGTLIAVGNDKLEPAEVEKIVAGAPRKSAGATAPPHGLCLMNVEYGGADSPI